MSWLILVVAGLFEVGFVFCLGKARLHTGQMAAFWWIGFVTCLFLSMFLLYKATLSLPMGTAYAVWTGIGAVGTVIIGVLVFKEPLHFWRIFFLSLLILSIIGLKATTR